MVKVWIYLGLFFAVLLAPFVLRTAVPQPVGEQLVVITPNNPDIRREFALAFSKWHAARYGAPVTLDFRSFGTADIERLLKTTYNSLRDENRALPSEEDLSGKISVNVFWGGGDVDFETVKAMGILDPLDLTRAQLSKIYPAPKLSGVKLYEQTVDARGNPLPPRWAGVCLSSFGIMYNPDVYRAIGLTPPATWSDLTNPKLFDMLGLADPTHSGSVAVCYMMVIQRAMADEEERYFATHIVKHLVDYTKDPDYQAALADGFHKGMGTLLLMAANARYFEASATLPPQDIANGDVAAGTVIDFYAHVAAQAVGPERGEFVVPENATAITPDPVAILYGTVGRRRELADHFVEFLLSPEGQRLWILKAGAPGGPVQSALWRAPIRQDVYGDRANWAEDVDPFTQASAFNMRGAWMALFTDIRPIWSAAWIDARDELLAADRKIAAIHDPLRRQQLFAELADLPMTMQDVQNDNTTRKKLEAAGNADAWKAQRRIEWAKLFRDHFNKIADESAP